MTPGIRGWVVLAFNVALIAAAAGWYAGGLRADASRNAAWEHVK